MIPIIYIHLGSAPEYLKRSIDSASVYKNKIILLADFNFSQPNVECISSTEFQRDLDLFDAAYKHMSTNTEKFEKICLKRWFILRNFMFEKNLDVCYYSDSDVMIYDNLDNVYNNYFKDFDASYTLTENQDNYRWTASACCSYWKKETLNNFCNFILDIYSPENIHTLEEKWNYHKKNNVAGGICDMTLLYLFSKTIKFHSLSKVTNGICFDSNMSIAENYFPDEYETIKKKGLEINLKKIIWKNDKPFAYNKVLKQEIRFVALTEYSKLLLIKRKIFGNLITKVKHRVKKILHN